ncbi:1051_t:CDS:2 [Paraglomus occultum]|uniref:1051_t:CDS:1 n=1 Tax=Paraglomus occultum TaxID=144539 RepID=A0A9N9BJ68_9GLOM|nr:1051_t:CDS:2 [Paraglomus occultum]
MSTQQISTTSPEYGDSLGPSTYEKIDLPNVFIDLKSIELTTVPLTVPEKISATTDIEGKANSDKNSRGTDYVSPWILISDTPTESRETLIVWCVIEIALRLLAVYITAINYSARYTIINWLGIFLGKEYYVTFVNSIWPDSNPFDPIVDWPGIKIDHVWLKQGFYYTACNLIIGGPLWIITWNEVIEGENDYAKSLATAGLAASLMNGMSYLVGIASMSWVYRYQSV